MKTYTRYYLIFILFIYILSLLLSMPPGPDLMVFINGAKAIASGNTLYKDYIDIKPPLIYYIYYIIIKIFGTGEYSIRYFDVCLQILNIMLIYKMVYKFSGNPKASYLAAFIYLISYVNLGATGTLQCETLAAPLFIIILYIQASGDNRLASKIIQGITLGLIISLKYTLGIILIPLLIDTIYNNGLKRSLKQLAIIGLSGICIIIIVHIHLLNPELRNSYFTMLKYLSDYSSVASINLSTIKNSINMIGYYFGGNYSLLLTFLLFIGFIFTLSPNLSFLRMQEFPEENYPFLRLMKLSLLFFIFLFISIIIENKFFVYHFSRFYLFSAILSAGGVIFLSKFIALFHKKHDLINRFLLFCLMIFAFIFSPLPRLAQSAVLQYYYFANAAKYDAFIGAASYYKQSVREQNRRVAEICNVDINSNDLVEIIGISSSNLGVFMKPSRRTSFGQPYFYLSKNSPGAWKEKFYGELNEAKWLIINTDDSQFEVTNYFESSYEMILKDSIAFKYLKNNFKLVDSTKIYKIYLKYNRL
ncbi:MAG: glycosyltransferase family 39 protein [Candidatus Kapabacteria bacterium]|nr:glycosyltransferase family 39 protein [Candidatus Kapabacteria bacterium]